MKKLILSFAVVCFAAMGAQAQDAKSTTLSLGVNAGVPTNKGMSVAYGADLQADFAVAPTLKITGSVGYENYKMKDITILGTTIKGGNSGYIPLLAGAKFGLGSDQLYGHAQLGYSVSTAKGGGGAFAYAPSIGYYFSPNFDASVKYLAMSKNGATNGSVNLRLAYNF